MNLSTTLKIIAGLPKSVFLNARYLGLTGIIKLPIFVSWRTQFIKLSGRITFSAPLSIGMVRIGIGGSGTASRTPSKLELNGNINFGKGVILGGGGTLVTVNSSSHLTIGNDVQITGDTKILCADEIKIGDDSVISWDCQIMDTDFHSIKVCGQVMNKNKPIIIGKHCWIGSRCCITKGTVIPDGCIIASDSTITKSINQPNAVYTGMPLRMLQEGVDWER
ncbi:acyltransferase [Clostridium transplantifaecale]|uniref:acyltransferase n=1 Tax=Clostridium transplantifaecale TaxID=2479838 RepID=UPI0013DE5C1F|nr:acyltransferase [Clostridium transplantifaecale]